MEDVFFSIYDDKGKYIGFTDSLEDAEQMAIKYNGRWVLEFAYPKSIFE